MRFEMPLVAEALPAGAKGSHIELQFTEGLAMEDWAEIGRKLYRMDQTVKWWIGDWAAFGVHSYGRLKEFADLNGINYGTLRNLAWVSEKVELSRRRDNVDWSKHAEVAALPPGEQEAWLRKAEHIPVAELRRQIRRSGAMRNALAPDGPSLRFGTKACDDLGDWLKARPAEFWDQERRAAWRAKLKPIAEFYERL